MGNFSKKVIGGIFGHRPQVDIAQKQSLYIYFVVIGAGNVGEFFIQKILLQGILVGNAHSIWLCLIYVLHGLNIAAAVESIYIKTDWRN